MASTRPNAIVLEYDSARKTWSDRQIDLLGEDSSLPAVCYVFLEAGDWYAKCQDAQRRRILEPFNAPDFLSTKLCTDLNGFFGSRSSYASNKNNLETLNGLSTWFRILSKKVLGPEEGLTSRSKDYQWYEMGFFTYWQGSVSRVLCIGTPAEFRVRLLSVLSASRAPDLELRDPLALLWPLFDDIIRHFDDHVWRVTKQVRAIELGRSGRPNFERQRNLSRHTGHLVEVEQVTIETMQRILALQESIFKSLPEPLSRTYCTQRREYLEFQVQVINSLKLRTQSTHDRLAEEITLAYNTLASQDNEIMKSITLLTMVFLPATFVSALFSTTFFSFDKNGWQISSSFWIYWVVTIPLTIVLLILWWWWLGGSHDIFQRFRPHWLEHRKAGSKP